MRHHVGRPAPGAQRVLAFCTFLSVFMCLLTRVPAADAAEVRQMKILGVQLGDTVDQIKTLFPETKFRKPGRTDPPEAGAYLGFLKSDNQRLDFGFARDGTLIRMIARVRLPEGRTVHDFLRSLSDEYGPPTYAEGKYDRRMQYRQIDANLREIANLSVSIFRPRYLFQQRVTQPKRPWVVMSLLDNERTRAFVASEKRRMQRRKGEI